MAKKKNKYAGGVYEEPYDPTGISRYLGLGRPFDFSDANMRLAGILAVAARAVMVWSSMNSVPGSDAAMSALGMALGVILSFMIGQELDPDRPFGGVIGGLLSAAAYFITGESNVVALLWLLFIMRMLTRTSGDRHRVGDNILIIGLSVWLGKDGSWMFPVITGMAYIVESQIQWGYFRSLYLAAIAFCGAIIAEKLPQDNSLTFTSIYMMAFVFILFLPELRVAVLTKFRGDKNNKQISPRRLQAAQGMIMLIIISLALMHGTIMVNSLMPALMACLGCGIYLLVCLIRRKVH